MSDTYMRIMERRADEGDVESAAKHRWERLRNGLVQSRSIVIDGETFIVDDIFEFPYEGMITIQTECGEDYILAVDSETAGRAARESWEERAKSDPVDFRHMVGDETLVAWAMGQPAGPGSTKVTSLNEWLDLWLETPAEEFAGYDGEEREVGEMAADLDEEIGFVPTVAYRTN